MTLRLPRSFAQVLDFLVGYEGSTRSAALLRVLAVILLWARHAGDHLVARALDDPFHTAYALVFFFGPALVLIGLWTRASIAVTTLSMIAWHIYVLETRGPSSFGSTEYIIYLFIGLCFTDCGKSLSIDRHMSLRRAAQKGAAPPEERGPIWGLRIICWHVSMMYFWGAFDKTDLQWIAGERMERYYLFFYGTSDFPTWPGFTPLMASMAVGVLVLEYALAVGLWFRLGRRYLVIPGLLLHFGMYAFLPAFHISWHMWIAYLAFIPADDFHRFVDAHLGHAPAAAA